jgi:hypothetical protein
MAVKLYLPLVVFADVRALATGGRQRPRRAVLGPEAHRCGQQGGPQPHTAEARATGCGGVTSSLAELRGLSHANSSVRSRAAAVRPARWTPVGSCAAAFGGGACRRVWVLPAAAPVMRPSLAGAAPWARRGRQL